MSEEQTFRSEVNGSLPLSGHRHRWFKMKSRTYIGAVRKSEKDFELYSWVPSLLPVCSSLKGPKV
jgi:hypothetical protein